MKKLEKARALLSNRTDDLSYEAVLEAALDEFLKDHDPEERKNRREERKQKAEASHKLENREAKKTVGSRAEGGIGSVGCGAAEGLPRSGVKAGCGAVDGPLFRRRAGDRPSSRVPTETQPSRRIPAATRDAVFARDEGRCTYVGSNGARCSSTRHLQIDHVIPYARGGSNAPGNLRLLCERHTKLEGKRVLGANIVRRARRGE